MSTENNPNNISIGAESIWDKEKRIAFNRAMHLIGINSEKQLYRAVTRDGLPFYNLGVFYRKTGFFKKEIVEMMEIDKKIFWNRRSLTPNEADRLMGISLTVSTLMRLSDAYLQRPSESVLSYFRDNRPLYGEMTPMKLMRTETGRRYIMVDICRTLDGVY